MVVDPGAGKKLLGGVTRETETREADEAGALCSKGEKRKASARVPGARVELPGWSTADDRGQQCERG